MDKIVKKLTLDLGIGIVEKLWEVQQWDQNSYELRITLTNDGETITPTGTIKLIAQKSDGTRIHRLATIDGTDVVISELGKQIFVCKGLVDCQLQFTDGDQKLGTPRFYIFVLSSTIDDDEIKSNDDYQDLSAAVTASAASQAAAKASETNAALSASAAAQSANNAKNSETAAKASETAASKSAEDAKAAVDLQIVDDATGTKYQFGAVNGVIYLKEV